MNPGFSLRAKLLSLLGTLSLVLKGCFPGFVHTICFRPVDAATKEPLAGVCTTWSQHKNQMFARIRHEGPNNLPPSRQNEMIKIGGMHTYWINEFIFSCPGYSNVYGFYQTPDVFSRSTLELGPQIETLGDEFDGQFIIRGNVRTASKSNGCFVVPMPK